MSVSELPFQMVRVQKAEAGDMEGGTDGYVVMREVDLQQILDELGTQQHRSRAHDIKMHNLRITAKATTTTLNSITEALADQFNLELDTANVNIDEEYEEQPPEGEDDREEPPEEEEDPQGQRQPQTTPAVPAANRKHKLQAPPTHTSTPKKPRTANRNEPAGQPLQSDGTSTDAAGGGAKNRTKKKTAADKRSARRVVTPIAGSRNAVLVTWELNSKGFVALDTDDLSAKSMELLGITKKLTKGQMKKLWQADAAGDKEGIVSDTAVSLLNHIADTLLGDLAEKGPVVLEREVQLDMGDVNDDGFPQTYFDKLPEPIRTAMYYVQGTVLTGAPNAASRNDVILDAISNVKPYLKTIRQNVPFPPVE